MPFFRPTSGGRTRASGGMGTQVIGAEDVIYFFEHEVERTLAYDDVTGTLKSSKTLAQREIRHAAEDIGKKIVIPQLKRSARSSPMKIARAMAETARAKRDRFVVVQIGGVNPPLRGFKRGVGEGRSKGTTATGRAKSSKNYRTTLAWGSEFGPHPSNPKNTYGQPRNESGYWVQPAIKNATPDCVRAYRAALTRVMLKWSVNR